MIDMYREDPELDMLDPFHAFEKPFGAFPHDLITVITDSFVEVEQREAKKQAGGGLVETGLAVIKAAQVADDVIFGPVGAAVNNTLSHAFNQNPEWKPISAGERHMVLPTKHGLTRANFAGPGTNLRTRLPRGDIGVDGPTGIDAAARQHDIDYTRSRNAGDVRAADDLFLQRVSDSSQGPKTKALVRSMIQAKEFGEDSGLLDPLAFTGNFDHELNDLLDQLGEGDDNVQHPLPAKRRRRRTFGPPRPPPRDGPRGRGLGPGQGPGEPRPGMRLRTKLKRQGRL